jgi:hypothetical protein
VQSFLDMEVSGLGLCWSNPVLELTASTSSDWVVSLGRYRFHSARLVSPVLAVIMHLAES